MLKNGVIINLSKKPESNTDTLTDNVKIRVHYTSLWDEPIGDGMFASIHSTDRTVSNKSAYSASGIVAEIDKSTSSIFVGSRVAVFGISDCVVDKEYIVANIRDICLLDELIPMKDASLVSIGARYFNIVKQMAMPLGSKVSIDANDPTLWNDILTYCGYSVVSSNADYRISDKSIKKEYSFAPGADWGDESVYKGERTYPRAYVANCVRDNVKTFLAYLTHSQSKLNLWAEYFSIKEIADSPPVNENALDLSSKPIFSANEEDQALSTMEKDDVILDCAGSFSYKSAIRLLQAAKGKPYNMILVNSVARSKLGDYANELYARSRPVIILSVYAEGNDKMQSIFRAITEVNEWVASEPVTVMVIANNSVVIISYKDGSTATIRIIPGKVADFSELHWEGKTITLTSSRIKAFGCYGHIGKTIAATLTAECARMRNECYLKALNGEN